MVPGRGVQMSVCSARVFVVSHVRPRLSTARTVGPVSLHQLTLSHESGCMAVVLGVDELKSSKDDGSLTRQCAVDIKRSRLNES